MLLSLNRLLVCFVCGGVIRFLQVLLFYVDPGLAGKLDDCDLIPELYATAWLITLFSRYVVTFLPRGTERAHRLSRRHLVGPVSCALGPFSHELDPLSHEKRCRSIASFSRMRSKQSSGWIRWLLGDEQAVWFLCAQTNQRRSGYIYLVRGEDLRANPVRD